MSFDRNDRAAILAALADPDANNPVAVALAARLKELTGRYWLHAEKLGRVPTELMLVKPTTAFDDIAYRLHLNTVADAVGQKLTVVWVDAEQDTANPADE